LITFLPSFLFPRDLKRNVEKKLEKLNRRTQRSIVEIIREPPPPPLLPPEKERHWEQEKRGKGWEGGGEETEDVEGSKYNTK
jgi:hypothetical protein